MWAAWDRGIEVTFPKSSKVCCPREDSFTSAAARISAAQHLLQQELFVVLTEGKVRGRMVISGAERRRSGSECS